MAKRGRPRDPNRDRTILDAARRVLAERGFTGATMEEVARTAGVGKDTLYRRWRSKEDLALAVLSGMATEAVRPLPLDPDPRFDLFVFLKDLVRLNRTTEFGPLVAGIVGEATRNADLATGFHSFWTDRRSIAAPLVAAVTGTTTDDPDVGHQLDGLLGPIYYRLMLTGEPVDDEYLWALVTELPGSADHEPEPSQPTTSQPSKAPAKAVGDQARRPS